LRSLLHGEAKHKTVTNKSHGGILKYKARDDVTAASHQEALTIALKLKARKFHHEDREISSLS
jgi:hypothetical protein